MTNTTPLPPHLERFVHQQIAAGGYHSEDEVIRAALHLLEGTSLAGATPGRSGPPGRAALGERWETPAEWLAGSTAKPATPPPPRRSPRGLLADLGGTISFDDVREARSELWSGLHPGGV